MPTRARAGRLLALPLATALSATAISTGGLIIGSSNSAADASLARREHKVHHAVRIARRQIGDPYVYGANGPGAFDCSGLTSFAFRHAGFRIPRTSDAQYDRVRHIKKRNIRLGDLVFFHSGGDVYHVGIYLKRKNGHRIILHSPYPGKNVHRERIWTRSWWAGTLRKPHR
jgi:cell wall-associated NlpC family hydrolase